MFIVEIGYKKSRYTIKYQVEKEAQARLLYAGLNIGNGFKKRLREGHTVLERQMSDG